jgi:hypothetical protein
MIKRLLTEEEKQNDPRFPLVIKCFPEFDCYSDGSFEVNKDKSQGFAYLMEQNKKAIEEIKEVGIVKFMQKYEGTWNDNKKGN